MSRWGMYRNLAEVIPEDRFEADIFLDNAVHHLRNSHPYEKDAEQMFHEARMRNLEAQG